jgi:hypothetical protein
VALSILEHCHQTCIASDATDRLDGKGGAVLDVTASRGISTKSLGIHVHDHLIVVRGL